MTMKKRITSFALVLLMVLSSLAVLLPVTGVKAAAADGTTGSTTSQTYTKVTETPKDKSGNEDWSGKYLIVYEAKKYAFNGSLGTLDASSNYKVVNIADDNSITLTINSDDDKFHFEIKKPDATKDEYTIKSVSGKYIGATSNTNGMNTNATTEYKNTISVEKDGNATIKSSGGAFLRFNANSGQDRFRYYKSSSYTAQKAIQLYKLVEESGGESGCKHNNLTYTYKDGDTHIAKCDDCSEYEVESTCNYKTTVGADGTNTFTCDKCGHVKTYTPAELVAAIEALGSGEYFVGDCILTGYISKINYPYSKTNPTPTFTIMVAGKEVYCFKATGAFVADFVLGDVVTLTGAMMNFKGNTVEFYQAEITDCKKTISSATLNIGTNIDVNYYVVLPEGISYEKYVMRFTFNGKTTNVESTTGDKFTFKNVGPHQMGLNLSAVLYGVNGETETKLSEKATYSVKENLESLLTNKNETVKTLAKNMLIYGAAAQKYTGAADADLVTSETHTATPTLPETAAASVDNKNEFVNFVGMKLIFDNEPRLAIKYVLLNDATANNVTFDDLNGKLTHDGEYVYLNGVTADKFAEENIVGNTLDYSTVTFTVNTYIYYILKNSTDANMKALATALYYYGVAAEAYVNAQTTQQ